MFRSRFFYIFIAVSLVSHFFLFTVFKAEPVPVKIIQSAPKVQFYAVKAAGEELLSDKDGVKVFTKILGTADKTFYSLAAARGFSGRYFSMPEIPHPSFDEWREEDDGSDAAGAKGKFAGAEIMPGAFFDGVKATDRPPFAAVETEVREFYRVVAADQVKESRKEGLSYKIEGEIQGRGIYSKELPFFEREKRVLDVTTRSKEEILRDNTRVKFWVDGNGIVKFTLVDRSSGSSRLDNICVNALKTWRFIPAGAPGDFDCGTITFIFE